MPLQINQLAIQPKIHRRTLLTLFLMTLTGCGGGKSSENEIPNPVPSNDAAEYRSWLSSVLSDQRNVVSDSSAQFVELQDVSDTNLTSNLIGWVRQENQSVDQLRRFSSTPEAVDRLLAEAVNRISSAGTVIEIKDTFSTQSNTKLNIPILTSVLDFARNQMQSSEVTVSISYNESKTSWLSDIALRKLLSEGGFTSDFLRQVSDGKVRIYRGVLSISDVKITLSSKVIGNKTLNVGATFAAPKGLLLKIDRINDSVSSGSITLSVGSDLFVGIAERLLSPSDIGRIVQTHEIRWGNANFSQKLDIDRESLSGTATVRNLSGFTANHLTIYSLLRARKVSGEEVCLNSVQNVNDLLPDETMTYNVDFNIGEPTTSIPVIHSYALGGFAEGITGSIPWTGLYQGRMERGGDSSLGGLGSSAITVSGFISADGVIHFHRSDTLTSLVEGRIEASGKFLVSSTYGSKEGTVRPVGGGLEFYFDPSVKLLVQTPSGGSSF